MALKLIVHMKIYLSLSQIPELKGLTRRQRKAVYLCAMEALFAEQPEALWTGAPWLSVGTISGALAGWLVFVHAGVLPAAGPREKWILAGVCAFAGVLAGNLIGTQILHARLRPYFRRVREERRDEIARMN